MYLAEGSYKKAKYTGGFSFIEEVTKENYRGYYIEDNKGRYYSGKGPSKDNVRLIKVDAVNKSKLTTGLKSTLIALAAGLASKVISDIEKQNGKTKRYFIQDKTTGKISETDKSTFTQAKQEMSNQNFSEVDWIIAGPAEDLTYGTYLYEGASTKNEKAIKALESEMKGISTFITDYSYLVEDLALTQKANSITQTQTVTDADTVLDNSRKANFDTKQ